jgi:glucose-1-phosphate adenylyltransferase
MYRRDSKVLGMVLAGGKGTRLHPLTWKRTKPAVPFASKYRIIDFALNNMINSGIYGMSSGTGVSAAF